jgi:hypothetical protein
MTTRQTTFTVIAPLVAGLFMLVSPTALPGYSQRRATLAAPLKTFEADSLQHLLSETYSGLYHSFRAVLQDSSNYRDVWDRATLEHRKLPPVDFSRNMVIVVAMGTRSSTQHRIRIQSVKAAGPTLQVRVLLVSPGPGCIVGNAETYPVDIVRVPRDDRAVVTFIERFEEERCGSHLNRTETTGSDTAQNLL